MSEVSEKGFSGAPFGSQSHRLVFVVVELFPDRVVKHVYQLRDLKN